MRKDEIWVICDRTDRCNHRQVKQILTKAKELGEKSKMSVILTVIGDFAIDQFDEMLDYGVDKIFLCKSNPIMDVEEYSNILELMIRSCMPRLMLFPASETGRTAAAFMSVRFNVGLSAECVDVEYKGQGHFVFFRAAISSSVIAKIECINSEIEMCTIKENMFMEKRKEKQKSFKIEYFKDYDKSKIKQKPSVEILSRRVFESTYKPDIENARVIFAAGRGISNPETLNLLKKVADKYGAEIVGTRAAVEENIIEKNRQVGQSGASITPDIYVGFGISGASQHIVGIKNSKLIIAINIDTQAPIFNFTDYMIVDDINAILIELDKAF